MNPNEGDRFTKSKSDYYINLYNGKKLVSDWLQCPLIPY